MLIQRYSKGGKVAIGDVIVDKTNRKIKGGQVMRQTVVKGNLHPNPLDISAGNWSAFYGALITDYRTATFPVATSDTWGDYGVITTAFTSNPDLNDGYKHVVVDVRLSGVAGTTIGVDIKCDGGPGEETVKNIEVVILTTEPQWVRVDYKVSAASPAWGPGLYIWRNTGMDAATVYIDEVVVTYIK